MKTATVSAIPAGEASDFAWTWRSSSGDIVSAAAFAFYYDCVLDAKEHGYEVELTQAQGHTAPGGVGYALS